MPGAVSGQMFLNSLLKLTQRTEKSGAVNETQMCIVQERATSSCLAALESTHSSQTPRADSNAHS